jgi:acyl dehydratase
MKNIWYYEILFRFDRIFVIYFVVPCVERPSRNCTATTKTVTQSTYQNSPYVLSVVSFLWRLSRLVAYTMYKVFYNAKDLILYALSLGMKSDKSDVDELKFVYENHAEFKAFPTFCLALTFFAGRQLSSKNVTRGIPSFPPPLMAKEQIIPRRFLRDSTIDLSEFPMIHTWQSVAWHSPLQVPDVPIAASIPHSKQVGVAIDLKTISVQPKSIGTFVTTISHVSTTDNNHNKSDQRLCTMQSTTLLLGLSSDSVLPFNAGVPRLSNNPKVPDHEAPIFEWTYRTTESQALLYRLASGDSNRIHVESSVSELLGLEKEAPLLHGLFTLALAFRAIVKLTGSNDDVVARKLEGKFSHPAFVGDTLRVKVWNSTNDAVNEVGDRKGANGDLASTESRCPVQDIRKRFIFVVINQDTETTLVDCGFAEVEIARKNNTSQSSVMASLSRL